MMQPDKDHRHSRALEPEIVDEDAERKLLEVRNHLKQYDSAVKIVQSALERGSFKLRPSVILAIHRDGYSGLSAFAGTYRPGSALIEGSQFEPPAPWLIAELMEDMCDYVNERWGHTTAVHLAAYVMWRLNWIHPFIEGNGSTARLLSYVVLSIRWGGILPGTPTIPEQIAADRKAYFEALEYSDRAWSGGQVDVSRMEELITSLLVRQLTSVKS
ncbi:Fic family protein [Bradyrhizobium manausense]|uniref:Fic family protein n=1 Tax=Bradyrhizobium manausense TaxID=989370 RepID=UPI001BA756DF|nr:Fic family protein [Bradyrhizobium manausense]MBR0726771.1 Fic family protein [Bradyrhizobium manausense]